MGAPGFEPGPRTYKIRALTTELRALTSNILSELNREVNQTTNTPEEDYNLARWLISASTIPLSLPYFNRLN